MQVKFDESFIDNKCINGGLIVSRATPGTSAIMNKPLVYLNVCLFRALLVSHGVCDVWQVVDALARPEKSSGQPIPVFRSRFARGTWRSG